MGFSLRREAAVRTAEKKNSSAVLEKEVWQTHFPFLLLSLLPIPSAGVTETNPTHTNCSCEKEDGVLFLQVWGLWPSAYLFTMYLYFTFDM